MKISVTNERDNPLLKRKELQIEIEHDASATPSKAAVQQLIAKEFNKAVENVDIRNIFSGSGISSSKANVFLWEEKKVEDLSKAVKKKEAKEEKKEEIKQEGPTEEKEEQKKEEKPAEKEAE